MSNKLTCPTCGSDKPQYRYDNSAYDANVKIRGNISVRVGHDTSYDSTTWYCGPCPDAWHDYERRSGKDRRK